MLIGKLLNVFVPLLCSFLFSAAFLTIALIGIRRSQHRAWRVLIWSAAIGLLGTVVSTLLWSPISILGLKLQTAEWIYIIELASFVSNILLLLGLALLAFRDNRAA